MKINQFPIFCLQRSSDMFSFIKIQTPKPDKPEKIWTPNMFSPADFADKRR
jgi:hypothetical protein